MFNSNIACRIWLVLRNIDSSQQGVGDSNFVLHIHALDIIPSIENYIPFQHHFSPNQLALRALHIAFHHSKVLSPT